MAVLLPPLTAQAADLSKVDRSIGKEPAYQAKPKYCLVVFGPEARARVWLVVDGDFIMTAAEVQPVLRALRKADIHVVALHNHMVGEQPAFYFTHFWGKGKAEELAKGVKAALDAQKEAGGKGH
jgi:hypothetical protein